MSTDEIPPTMMVVPQDPHSHQLWPQPPMPTNMNGDQSYAGDGAIMMPHRKPPRFAWMAVCGGAQRRREEERFERHQAHQEQVMAMQRAGYAAGSGFAHAGQLASVGISQAGSDIRSGVSGAGMDIREGIVSAGEHMKSGLQHIGERMGSGISNAGAEVRTGLESAGRGVETAGVQVQAGIHRAGTSVEQGVRKHGDTIYDGMVQISKTCIWIATSVVIITVGYTSMWVFMSDHKDAESVELGSFTFRWSVGLFTGALCIRCVAAALDDHRWVSAAVCTLGWAGISLVMSGFLVAFYISTRVKFDIGNVRGALDEIVADKRLAAAWSNAVSAVVAGLITSLVFLVVPGIVAVVCIGGSTLVQILCSSRWCSLKWWQRCCGVFWACVGGFLSRLLWLVARIADCVIYVLKALFGFVCACMEEVTKAKPRRPTKPPRTEKNLQEPLLSGADSTGSHQVEKNLQDPSLSGAAATGSSQDEKNLLERLVSGEAPTTSLTDEQKLIWHDSLEPIFHDASPKGTT